MRKIKILVEAVGNIATQGFLKMLTFQKEYEYEVIGLTSEKSFVENKFVSKVIDVPLSESLEYIPKVLAICKREKIDLFIPFIDYGFHALAKSKDAFHDTGTRLVLSDNSTLTSCLDKYETYKVLKESGISTPETCLGTDINFLSNDYIIKPRFFGRAPEKVFELSDKDIRNEMFFETFLRVMKYGDKEDVLVQEKLSGVEFTADCMADFNSKLIYVIPRERVKVKGGIAVQTRLMERIEGERIIQAVKNISNRLSFKGPYNIQGFVNKGKFWITEINPRFGGSSVYTHYIGVNSAAILIDLFLNKVPQMPDNLFDNRKMMVRYFEEIIY